MKIKLLLNPLAFGLPAIICCLTARAQTNVYFSFTVAPDYKLSDACIIDTEPYEAYASVTPLDVNGQTNFGPGPYSSYIHGTTYGGNYLTLIGVYSTATSTNVAISVPQWLANTYIPGSSWDAFNAISNFPDGFLLPSESSTLNDLTNGNYYVLATAFYYLQTNAPVLVGNGQIGTLVAFDGAQSAGAFTFSLTPMLNISDSGNQSVVSWNSSATGWTLQTNNNLSTGTWGNYLGTVVNNSVTNAPPTGNVFFRLKQ